MATRTNVVLIDDIDGTAATQTVTFGLDGVSYEIDLNDEHADALRESLDEWVGKARRVGGRRAVGTGRAAKAGNSDTAKIRTWAQENGMKVSDRGRIPATIVEAYREAQA